MICDIHGLVCVSEMLYGVYERSGLDYLVKSTKRKMPFAGRFEHGATDQ